MSYVQLAEAINALGESNQALSDQIVEALEGTQEIKVIAQQARDAARASADEAETNKDTAQDAASASALSASLAADCAAQAASAAEVAAQEEVENLEAKLAEGIGSEKVGFQLTPLATWVRTLAQKAGEIVTPEDFGAIMDGTIHPLSERYDTVEQARFFYPGVWIDSLARSIDYAATQAAILHCHETNKSLLVLGVGAINDELIVYRPLVIQGGGPGRGYGTHFYVQTSGFKFFGTGTRRVRTRQKYRATAADPQDDPLSVGLNIQAANTVLRDISFNLHWTSTAPGELGDDWDNAIFIGCRTQVKLENVHVSSGYWRDAGIRVDVTQPSSGTPRFKDPFGVPFINDGPHGSDGLSMTNVYTYGGFFGVKVQGSDPAPGFDAFGPQYYDEEAGALINDNRGGFGLSDFSMINCELYGPEHSSFRRIQDFPAAPSRNDVPKTGAFYISGLASGSAGRLQGHRYIGCRFSTWEACRIYLGRTNRDAFIGCHQENHGGNGQTTEGVPTTASYGAVLRSPNCTNLTAITCNTDWIGSLYCPTMQGDSCVASDTGNNILSHMTVQPGDGIVLAADGGPSRILNSAGELDLRSATGFGVRLRAGATTLAAFTASTAILSITGALRANTDNVASCGAIDRRWTAVYANTGAINTSDAREKTQVIALTENEIKAAKLLSREIGTYKWLAMVAQKGDGARLHIGMTVQRAITIMESCDLNPFDYGFICYDQWADEYEDREATYETVYDDDGNAEKIELMSYERVKVSDAGDRYSFRHDELLLFIAAGVEARLAALEEAAL